MCLWLTREWSQSCHIEWDEQQHRRSLLTHSCEFTEKTFCSVDQGTFADARTNGTIEWWGLNSCFNLQTKLVQQICRESEHHEFWQLFQKEGKSRKKNRKKEHKNERLTSLIQEPFQLEHYQHCWHQSEEAPSNSCSFQSPYTQQEKHCSPWGC